MKNASEELWCSIRCKQNLHSIDLMILFKIRIVKNFESVKSFKILARLLLYDCSLSLGQSWLRINKSTGIWIQMHTFYAIQIYVIYRRMHFRKKWLLLLQNYCSAMKLFSPGSKHTATITHCFRRRRCFSYHSTRKKSLEIKFHLSWLSSWSYLWSVWCIQLIESCLPDGFGCDKCGESMMDIAITFALELIFYDCSYTHVHQKIRASFFSQQRRTSVTGNFSRSNRHY